MAARERRVILAAQFKAGKTTTVGNLVRSLVDGDPWLGDAQVLPVAGRVTILDNEMSESQAEDWLRKQGIRNSDRVALCCLRGKVSSFDILDPVIRSMWGPMCFGQRRLSIWRSTACAQCSTPLD